MWLYAVFLFLSSTGWSCVGVTYLAWEEGWPCPSFLFLSVSSIFLIRRQVDSGAVLSPQVAWSKWQWAMDNSSLACGLALWCPFLPCWWACPSVPMQWSALLGLGLGHGTIGQDCALFCLEKGLFHGSIQVSANMKLCTLHTVTSSKDLLDWAKTGISKSSEKLYCKPSESNPESLM